MIGEVALVWKVAGGMWALLTLGIGYWVNDLKAKHEREVKRADDLLTTVNRQSNRITKLEADTVTETQVLRMLGEMERRISDNFKDFRLEFKEDFNSFKVSVREIFKETQHRGD